MSPKQLASMVYLSCPLTINGLWRYKNSAIRPALRLRSMVLADRLRPKNWVDDNLAVLFETDFQQNHIRLYDEDLNEDFFRKQFDRINSVKINII